MQRNYTAADVKGYRDEHSCSLFEAKAHFEKRFFLDRVENLRHNYDPLEVVNILEELVSRMNFR